MCGTSEKVYNLNNDNREACTVTMALLEPRNRLRLMEQFRPPEGFRLDRVIGTTFSLDLLSLLMAPLSMVMFECEDKDEAMKDPTALLEALRLTADRIVIFCQKGRISVPKNTSYLLSYLEPMIVEVEPEQLEGVFHSKVWLLRYLNKDKEIRYRFLCLSRNLTFDKSWDTILSLEGRYDSERQRAFSRNRPLSEFFGSLVNLSKNVSPAIKKNVKLMADEALRVVFELPDPFEDIQFHPIGIEGYKKGPEINGYDRSLVISPFLSDEIAVRLAEKDKKNILISRPESFDNLNMKTLSHLGSDATLYIMEHEAERPPTPDDDLSEPEALASGEDPNGLHAKLYLLESGWNVSVITGSANATIAGLSGINVEFLTELVGKKSRVGIDALLGKTKDALEMTLQNLLIPYRTPDKPSVSDEVRKRLEKDIEATRRILTRAMFSGNVLLKPDNKYSLELSSGKKFELPNDVVVTCWPIMLPETYERDISPVISGGNIAFCDLTLLALTRFFAFRVVAREADRTIMITFILNLPVVGMPEERNKSILQHIIGNSERFTRYLLFLLAEDPEKLLMERIIKSSGSSSEGEDGHGSLEIPLFEELVRAYSRHPEKLMRIDALVNDLKSSDHGINVLPKGFEDIWNTFKEAVSFDRRI